MTKRIVFPLALLLAALLACLNAAAQQPAQTDYVFTHVVAPGTVILDHQADKYAGYIGPAEINSRGDVVYTAQWADPIKIGGLYKGVYTATRAVIEEREVTGRRTIVEVLNARKGDLQINGNGKVSYLARFSGPGCSSSTCEGIFVEKDLMALVGSGGDVYTLTEDAKVSLPAGSTPITPATETPVTEKSGGLLRKLGRVVKLPPLYFPLSIPPIPGAPRTMGPVVLVPTLPNGAPATPTPKTPTASIAPVRPAEPAPAAPVACPIPSSFPFPFLWNNTGSAGGPIATSRTEGISYNQTYSPRAHTAAKNWVRKIYFAADCSPILLTLSELSGLGAIEIWSPAGLVAYLDEPSRSYKFSGVEDVALLSPANPVDSDIRINARCQILLPVDLRTPYGSQKNLIIGSPVKPGSHCPVQ